MSSDSLDRLESDDSMSWPSDSDAEIAEFDEIDSNEEEEGVDTQGRPRQRKRVLFDSSSSGRLDGIGDEGLETKINLEDEEEEEEEVNSATFIMNQKSLVDKAPGALQHSFAHRTIPLNQSFLARFFRFVSVFVICSMTAGIPFGLPALRQLLVDEGIYACAASSETLAASAGVATPTHTFKRVGCSTQESRLALFQVCGWVTWMIGGWLAARSVQRLGPRTTGIIGCASIMFGSLLLAASIPIEGQFWIKPPWARLYILPVMIMSIGSSFSFLACLHYVRLFPKRTSLLNSVIFLAQELSALVFYIMYESREFLDLRQMLIVYAAIMLGQVFFWKFVFPSAKIPTIRFTVTTWHQRPLMVEKSLAEHIASPYFYLALIFILPILFKIFFYMSTFQVQLTILLIPTKRQVSPEDFSYQFKGYFDEDGGDKKSSSSTTPTSSSPNSLNSNDPFAYVNSTSTSPYQNNIPAPPINDAVSITKQPPPQFISHVPFFAEQPGGNSSNNLSLRQFIYNPMQPEIFLTDLQEMMYLLVPIAALVTIFWMRSSMSDRKISTSLFFSSMSLVLWGFIQNVFSVKFQAISAMTFPVFRSVFTNGMYDYCERM